MKTIPAILIGAALFVAGLLVGRATFGNSVLVPAGSAFGFATEQQADAFRNAIGDAAAETIASQPGTKFVRTSRMISVRVTAAQ